MRTILNQVVTHRILNNFCL